MFKLDSRCFVSESARAAGAAPAGAARASGAARRTRGTRVQTPEAPRRWAPEAPAARGAAARADWRDGRTARRGGRSPRAPPQGTPKAGLLTEALGDAAGVGARLTSTGLQNMLKTLRLPPKAVPVWGGSGVRVAARSRGDGARRRTTVRGRPASAALGRGRPTPSPEWARAACCPRGIGVPSVATRALRQHRSARRQQALRRAPQRGQAQWHFRGL